MFAAVLTAGCNSCQQSPEIPAPVPQEGQLPKPPEPLVAAGTPQEPPPACAVVASASTEEGTAPLEVTLSAEGMCTDAAGTFTWDFGDGSEPTHEQNPVHVYGAAGTYTARVTLVDAEHNATDADDVTITVTAPQR